MMVHAGTGGFTVAQYLASAEHYGPDFIAIGYAQEHPADWDGLAALVKGLYALNGCKRWVEHGWEFVLRGNVRTGRSQHAGNKEGYDRRLLP